MVGEVYKGRDYARLTTRHGQEISVLTSRFCYELKTTLKKIVFLKNTLIVSHGEFDSGEDMLILDLEQIPPLRNEGLNNVDTARNTYKHPYFYLSQLK